jgi:hypothetical protein
MVAGLAGLAAFTVLALSAPRAHAVALPIVTTNLAGVYNPSSGVYDYDFSLNFIPGDVVGVPVFQADAIVTPNFTFLGIALPGDVGWNYTSGGYAYDFQKPPGVAGFTDASEASGFQLVFSSPYAPVAMPFAVYSSIQNTIVMYVDPVGPSPIPEPGTVIGLASVAGVALSRRRRA